MNKITVSRSKQWRHCPVTAEKAGAAPVGTANKKGEY